MLCVRAPNFEKRLIILAKLTGKTKSHYVRLALEILFDEITTQSEDGLALDLLDDPNLDFTLLPPSIQLVIPKTRNL